MISLKSSIASRPGILRRPIVCCRWFIMSCGNWPPQNLPPNVPGQTLNATALVHEAYLRLVGPEEDAKLADRRYFFAAAAEAMRRILVEIARGARAAETWRRIAPCGIERSSSDYAG